MDETWNDEGSFGMGGLQTMGIVNAFKTGDVYTDMVIAMCIPVLLKVIFSFGSTTEDLFDWESWSNWWRTRSFRYERTISYGSTRSSWGYVSNIDQDTENSVLLKAIKLYLHQKVNVKLTKANVELTGMEDKKSDFSSSYYCEKMAIYCTCRSDTNHCE